MSFSTTAPGVQVLGGRAEQLHGAALRALHPRPHPQPHRRPLPRVRGPAGGAARQQAGVHVRPQQNGQGEGSHVTIPIVSLLGNPSEKKCGKFRTRVP